MDLGSNSFRIVVADVSDDQTMARLFTRGEHLHLAASVARHGRIPAERAELAATAATDLSRLMAAWECERLRVVATSVFREAANGSQVVDRISELIGVPVEILGGQDEAAHALTGALWGFGAAEPLMVADLGGGGLELATGTPDRPPDWLGSLPLGVSRLAALMTPEERLRPHHRVHLEAHVAASMAPLRPLVDRFRERPLVIVGGTGRALGQLLATWREGSGPRTVHGLTLTTGDLARVVDRMGRLDLDGRRRIPGVKPRRARLLPVGAAILRQVMRSLGVSRAAVGETGLREGLLLDTALASQATAVA